MGSISGIGAAGAMLDSDNKSKTTSSSSEIFDEFHKLLTAASNSNGSSNNSDGSKTTMERTVIVGPDGSMTVTITQITTAPNGTQTSKVISTTKTGGSAGNNTDEKSGDDVLATKTQAQGSTLKNSSIASNYTSNEYNQNSAIGACISGVLVKKD